MAWIESHQTLKNDPKLFRFCRYIGVSRPAGIGMLHELWWFALDHAEDGDISKVDKRDLARELDYPERKADKLWEALTQESQDKTPGFLEKSGKIHNWPHYTSRLIGERIRKRAQRSRDSHGTGSGQSRSTVPYSTVPDQTKQIKESTAPFSPLFCTYNDKGQGACNDPVAKGSRFCAGHKLKVRDKFLDKQQKKTAQIVPGLPSLKTF